MFNIGVLILLFNFQLLIGESCLIINSSLVKLVICITTLRPAKAHSKLAHAHILSSVHCTRSMDVDKSSDLTERHDLHMHVQ